MPRDESKSAESQKTEKFNVVQMELLMDNEAYHAHPANGASMLKVADTDPWLFNEMFRKKSIPPADYSNKTPVIIGDACHQILLEQKEPDSVIAFYPDDCKKSNGAINPKPAAQYREEMAAQGKVVVKDDDFRRIIQICNSFNRDPISKLIGQEDVICEQPIFWTDLQTGLECKCKPDFMRVGETIDCYDLKISENPDPKVWSRIARRLKYYLQVAHYSNGLAHVYSRPVTFTFVVVESKAPHRITKFKFDDISMERANESYVKLLSELARRIEKDDWTAGWEGKQNYLTIEPWDLDLPEELEGFDE